MVMNQDHLMELLERVDLVVVVMEPLKLERALLAPTTLVAVVVDQDGEVILLEEQVDLVLLY